MSSRHKDWNATIKISKPDKIRNVGYQNLDANTLPIPDAGVKTPVAFGRDCLFKIRLSPDSVIILAVAAYPGSDQLPFLSKWVRDVAQLIGSRANQIKVAHGNASSIS